MPTNGVASRFLDRDLSASPEEKKAPHPRAQTDSCRNLAANVPACEESRWHEALVCWPRVSHSRTAEQGS